MWDGGDAFMDTCGIKFIVDVDVDDTGVDAVLAFETMRICAPDPVDGPGLKRSLKTHCLSCLEQFSHEGLPMHFFLYSVHRLQDSLNLPRFVILEPDLLPFSSPLVLSPLESPSAFEGRVTQYSGTTGAVAARTKEPSVVSISELALLVLLLVYTWP